MCHGEEVEFTAFTFTSNVNGKENRPSDDSANKHDDDNHSKESKEEVGIERLVLESICIWDLPEGANPIEISSR